MSEETAVATPEAPPVKRKMTRTWSRKKKSAPTIQPTETAALTIENTLLRQKVAELEAQNAQPAFAPAALPSREPREGDLVTYRNPTGGSYLNYKPLTSKPIRTEQDDIESQTIAGQQPEYRAKVMRVFRDRKGQQLVDLQIAEPTPPDARKGDPVVVAFEAFGVKYGPGFGQWSF